VGAAAKRKTKRDAEQKRLSKLVRPPAHRGCLAVLAGGLANSLGVCCCCTLPDGQTQETAKETRRSEEDHGAQ
jgi:hypothetical protein